MAYGQTLTALADLLRSREATPDFRLAVRLDGREALRRGFSGRAVEQASLPREGPLDGRRAIRLPLEGEGAPGPRYFVDASYCQTSARWHPVKPYWRHMLSRARELDLGGGRWPELFAERHFTEYTTTGRGSTT